MATEMEESSLRAELRALSRKSDFKICLRNKTFGRAYLLDIPGGRQRNAKEWQQSKRNILKQKMN
jgi:hypothetical protein